MHTHTHTHKHTPAHKHTCTYTHTHKHTPAHTHTQTHMYIHTHTDQCVKPSASLPYCTLLPKKCYCSIVISITHFVPYVDIFRWNVQLLCVRALTSFSEYIFLVLFRNTPVSRIAYPLCSARKDKNHLFASTQTDKICPTQRDAVLNCSQSNLIWQWKSTSIIHSQNTLTDWLMITYIALFSALLSRLTALACGSTWVTSFL